MIGGVCDNRAYNYLSICQGCDDEYEWDDQGSAEYCEQCLNTYCIGCHTLAMTHPGATYGEHCDSCTDSYELEQETQRVMAKLIDDTKAAVEAMLAIGKRGTVSRDGRSQRVTSQAAGELEVS